MQAAVSTSSVVNYVLAGTELLCCVEHDVWAPDAARIRRRHRSDGGANGADKNMARIFWLEDLCIRLRKNTKHKTLLHEATTSRTRHNPRRFPTSAFIFKKYIYMLMKLINLKGQRIHLTAFMFSANTGTEMYAPKHSTCPC